MRVQSLRCYTWLSCSLQPCRLEETDENLQLYGEEKNHTAPVEKNRARGHGPGILLFFHWTKLIAYCSSRFVPMNDR
ncbi:hypothetical protein SDJN02_27729 [Cucurbita argyrosperma subsp. argyrosperma]|nr:hypothetical protein SDJN02_27729 [Cucurbita argyrosperma subsp. argyrosperma]